MDRRPRRWLRALKGAVMRSMPLMATCREFEAMAQAALDGGLPPYKRWKFWLHLRLCRECRGYFAAYRRTVELGKALFAEPEAEAAAPRQASERLVQAVLAAWRR